MQKEKVPYNQRIGRKPTSREYDFGTKIWKELELGESVFVAESEGLNQTAVGVRLSRLGVDRAFSILSEESLEGIKGHRIYRIK